MTEQTFTFKSGLTVTLCRVNPIFIGKVARAAQDKYEKEHGKPKCPTYEAKVAGGTSEFHELTEDTIGLDPWVNDPEIQAQWAAYQTARLELTSARITETTKAYAIRGVAEEPPAEWVEDQSYWGLELPDDPRDVKWEWLQDRSTGWDELLDLVFAIQSFPNRIEEAARAAEDTFRGSVEPSDEGADAGTDSGEAENGEPE